MAHIRFSIEGKFENVRLVGQAINTICVSVCSSATAYQVELATVEACNNIVEHAYETLEGSIDIDVRLLDTLLELCFIDSGLEMNSTAIFGKEFLYDPKDLDNLPEGGMGLYLIDTIMDSKEYKRENGKNYLFLTKQLKQKQ